MKGIIIFVALFISVCTSCTSSCQCIDGIDVSRHQGVIDWKETSRSLPKKAFVYIKCTEGATLTDRNYRINATQAKSNKLYVGGYHYFRMTSSAHDQFINFKKALDSIDFDLIPMVDVETDDRHSKKRNAGQPSSTIELIGKRV